jgi:hypothetical protein
MLFFDGTRQHDDLACTPGRQRKTLFGGADVGQRSQHAAKPPDLDAQTCAKRFIGALQSEGARDKCVPRHIARPRFAKRACEREQHRSPRERNHLAFVTNDVTASVHDKGFRRQQRFDLLERKESFSAFGNQARGGCVQDEQRAFDLCRQRGDTCLVRCVSGPGERSTRRLRLKTPYRNSCNDQLVDGSQRRRQGRGVELGERTFGFVETPDQK